MAVCTVLFHGSMCLKADIPIRSGDCHAIHSAPVHHHSQRTPPSLQTRRTVD